MMMIMVMVVEATVVGLAVDHCQLPPPPPPKKGAHIPEASFGGSQEVHPYSTILFQEAITAFTRYFWLVINSVSKLSFETEVR